MEECNELSKKEVKQLQDLLKKFIKSYSNKDKKLDDREWLKKQFQNEIPNISEEDADRMAQETLDSINEYDDNLNSLNKSAKQGINKEQWLANNIAKAATGVSVAQHGEYLRQIDESLSTGNQLMWEKTITTKNGIVNKSGNLDGFIAERFHVNTFNANAALAKSKYYAEVKTPEAGKIYGKNSVDVVILDSTSNKVTPVHQYQVKYGATAKDTIKMLREHGDVTKYSNQQIVVPPEQVAEVQNAFPGKTIVSKIGGTDKVSVTSNELTKQGAKQTQIIAQELESNPTIDWNVFKTKELALNIGKNAGLMGIQAAAITTGFYMAQQAISGDGIDAEELVGVALATGSDAGIKSAVTGALKVAIETGIIGIIPKGTPVGILSNIVCVTIENIKILHKVAIGELTISQALDQMGRVSTVMVYGLGWGATGMGIGAWALSWIPVVGPVIGGVVGGMVGYMAGSKFGESVYEGLKSIKLGVESVCKSMWDGIKSARNKLNELIFS